MIKLTHQDGKRSCSYYKGNREKGLYVVSEFPATKNDAATKASLTTLLEASVNAHENLSDGVPRAVAAFVDRKLREATEDSDLPSWAFFVAILASSIRVEVCMAGPHRVHLVRGASVVASCREHVLRHDDPPPDWPPEMTTAVDLELQGSIVTRALGRMNSRPAETTVWSTTCPFRIVVCSPDVHQDRAPSVYLPNINRMPAAFDGSLGVLECLT